MNPLETSNIESLLHGVYERIKEQSQREKKYSQKPTEPAYASPAPVDFEDSEMPTLTLVMNHEGVWQAN